MTEQQLFESADLYGMLQIAQITDRQRRLFSVACCRRVQHLITDQTIIKTIDIAEKFADGKATQKELTKICDKAYEIVAAKFNVNETYANYAVANAVNSIDHTIDVAYFVACSIAKRSNGPVYIKERQWQVDILYHIVGNPFYPKPIITVPTHVTQLAKALYNQEPCHFALHDALLDAGYEPLAKHFRYETHHPKGCHILDLLCTR